VAVGTAGYRRNPFERHGRLCPPYELRVTGNRFDFSPPLSAGHAAPFRASFPSAADQSSAPKPDARAANEGEFDLALTCCGERKAHVLQRDVEA
jgi:hypothetical protein